MRGPVLRGALDEEAVPEVLLCLIAVPVVHPVEPTGRAAFFKAVVEHQVLVLVAGDLGDEDGDGGIGNDFALIRHSHDTVGIVVVELGVAVAVGADTSHTGIGGTGIHFRDGAPGGAVGSPLQPVAIGAPVGQPADIGRGIEIQERRFFRGSVDGNVDALTIISVI